MLQQVVQLVLARMLALVVQLVHAHRLRQGYHGLLAGVPATGEQSGEITFLTH